MPISSAGTEQAFAHRLLNAEGLARLLYRYAPRTYSSLSDTLAFVHQVANLREMHRELWPDVYLPPTTNIWSLTNYILDIINTDHFPIDYDHINELSYAGVDALDIIVTYLPFLSCGYPWPEMPATDIDAYVRPILALFAYQMPQVHATATHILDLSGEWWDDTGVPIPDDGLFWTMVRPDLTLRDLPAPLNGLAGAYYAVMRNTGNPFFDCFPAGWGIWDDWGFGINRDRFGWTSENIRDLSAWWRQAEPLVTAYKAYQDWHERTPDADTLIAQQFVALEEGRLINILGED